MWERCTTGAFASGDDHSVLSLYESFYRRLVLRDRSLPRPWIFTTNYDLFSERAMDRLGLPYANGFSGVVERRFNPATFRYALAEQLDISNRKWSAVDGFIYLCKLHGSISWTEDDHGLYPIRETWPQDGTFKGDDLPDAGKAERQPRVRPTPTSSVNSNRASFASRASSITMGYAFGDEHINNIIYQALTIPTFRLIVFAEPDSGRRDRVSCVHSAIRASGSSEGQRSVRWRAGPLLLSTIVEHLLPRQPVGPHRRGGQAGAYGRWLAGSADHR